MLLHVNFQGTILVNSSNKQVLDKLQVEKERGITVKAQVKCCSDTIDTHYVVLFVWPFAMLHLPAPGKHMVDDSIMLENVKKEPSKHH